MLIQLLDIFLWYIALQVFCIIGFILGFKIFSSLEYRGFSISKTFGLFAFSITCWFACNKSIGIAKYSALTLYILLFIFAGFCYYLYTKNKEEINNFVKTKFKYIFNIELTFLIFFLIFVLLRTYTPNIEGTEKPLEFVVINSILKTDYFPAIDLWLSGHPLNYYYLGQYFFSNIIKMTFIDPAIGFNLINPSILALVIIGSFEFIYELTRKVFWGVLAAFMTALMGNLEPLMQFLRDGINPNYFRWWDSGHVIPYSFPEFPYWSFLHSDVHAHFLVHPFTILFLFVILAFIQSGYYLITIEDFKNGKKFALNIMYCLILGSFMLTNSWNYPSGIALTFAGMFIYCYIKLPKTSLIVNMLRILPPGLFYILTSYVLYLSFYAGYNSPVEGIGFVDPTLRTTTLQLLILIGTFLLPIIILALFEFYNNLILNKELALQNKILAILLILLLPGLLFILTKSLVITVCSGIWLYFLISLLSRKLSEDKSFVYAISFLVFSLILCCEFIYVNDLFSGEYERQNTVAKSYIQILLLLPIATTYLMYVLSSKGYLKGILRSSYIITMTILILLSSTFLWIGTHIKNNRFERTYYEYNWHVPTLNGSNYISSKLDGEYEGIMWLKNNATKKDIVLEVDGKPYSHYGRVASHSGVASLINWAGSLNVLRGKYFYLISNPRLDDIRFIFNTENKRDVYMKLKENRISYIYIGPLERVEFPEELLKGFDKEKDLYKKVFKKGNTTIYKVI